MADTINTILPGQDAPVKDTELAPFYMEGKGIYVPIVGVYVQMEDIDIEGEYWLDWYTAKQAAEQIGSRLPTLRELRIIHFFKEEINALLKAHGGQPFAERAYWSSTEYSAAYAWYLNFSSGLANIITKATYHLRVRPVAV